MNKHLSTPHNCAMRKSICSYNDNVSYSFGLSLDINESVVQHSALALVNGQPWDMHRPLTEDCSLKFLFYTDADPTLVNKVCLDK